MSYVNTFGIPVDKTENVPNFAIHVLIVSSFALQTGTIAACTACDTAGIICVTVQLFLS